MYSVTDLSNPQTRESVFRQYSISKTSPVTWLLKGSTTHGIIYTYELRFCSVDEWTLMSNEDPRWLVRFLVTPSGIQIGNVSTGGRTYTYARYLKKYANLCMISRQFIVGNYCK